MLSQRPAVPHTAAWTTMNFKATGQNKRPQGRRVRSGEASYKQQLQMSCKHQVTSAAMISHEASP